MRTPCRKGAWQVAGSALLARFFLFFLLRGRLALRLHFGIGLGTTLGLGIGLGLRLVGLVTLLRGRLARVLRHHQRHCNGGSGQDCNGQQLLHEVLLAVWLGCFDPMGPPAFRFQRLPFYPLPGAEAEPQACKIAVQTAHLRVAPRFRR